MPAYDAEVAQSASSNKNRLGAEVVRTEAGFGPPPVRSGGRHELVCYNHPIVEPPIEHWSVVVTLFLLIPGIWINPSGLQEAAGVMVLASHTMPDFITPVFYLVVKWSLFPTLVCALLGAKIRPKSFQLRQISCVVLGLLIGMFVVIAFTVPVIISLLRFGPPAAIFVGAFGCVVGSWTAFVTARVSRPEPSMRKNGAVG